MNLVLVNGSPRRAGNSTVLAQAVAAGAVAAGARELPPIHIGGMRFQGCQNCGGCEGTGRCVLKDDMAEAYRQLAAANLWIFATPIYFDTLSGQLKLFFDRLFCLSKNKLPGTRQAVMAIAYEMGHNPAYAQNMRPFLGYLNWFGDFSRAELVEAWGMARAGDIHTRQDLLDRARRLGGEMVNPQG